jgi:site-specific DNA recombinase
MGYSKKGRHVCPDSKGIPEEAIYKAFVESYNRIIGSDDSFLDEFIARAESCLNKGLKAKGDELNEKLKASNEKIDRLGMLFTDGSISKEAFDSKRAQLMREHKDIEDKIDGMGFNLAEEEAEEKRLSSFKEAVRKAGGGKLLSFDRSVFESCVKKVIIGGKDSSG